jgi:hypothetical protein
VLLEKGIAQLWRALKADFKVKASFVERDELNFYGILDKLKQLILILYWSVLTLVGKRAANASRET